MKTRNQIKGQVRKAVESLKFEESVLLTCVNTSKLEILRWLITPDLKTVVQIDRKIKSIKKKDYSIHGLSNKSLFQLDVLHWAKE